MNTVKGSIVKAVAGREKNGFFVVLDCDSVFAYIADGKRRKVEKPKKKKLIHISPTENNRYCTRNTHRYCDRGFNQDQSADKKNFEQF